MDIKLTCNPEIERWNKKWLDKYKRGCKESDFYPDDFLLESQRFIPTNGKVLDLACGIGRNSVYLAKKKYNVDALDGSSVAISFLKEECVRENLTINILLEDVELYKLPSDYYDIIIVARFHKMDYISEIVRSCKSGGIIIYAIFNKLRLIEIDDYDNNSVIRHGELSKLFPEQEILYTNDKPLMTDSLTYIVLKKVDK